MAANDITKTGSGRIGRPVDIFSAMRDEMDRMFERFETGWPRGGLGMGRDLMVPQIDVRDDGDKIAIEIDLPGVSEKDVTLTVNDGVLSIKGEKRSEREEKKDNYYVAERSFGSFERALRLPEGIDEGKLEARFEKGVLKVVAPKKPEAVKAEKRIEIKAG